MNTITNCMMGYVFGQERFQYMPKPKYEKLKSRFEEAFQNHNLQEFIKVLQVDNVASHIDYFFLGCAYDVLGNTPKAHEYYSKTIQHSNKDNNTAQMVKVIYEFVLKTGISDLLDLIIKRELPGMNIISQHPVKSQNNQPTKPHTIPEKAFQDAKVALANSDLEKSLELLLYVYQTGYQTLKCQLLLSVTYQRLNQPEQAIFYLNEGIKLGHEQDDYALLLRQKAQICSSQNEWESAVKAYEALLPFVKQGSRERQDVFRKIINIYRWYLAKPKKIELFLRQLVREFPEDPYVLKLKADIEGYNQDSTIPSNSQPLIDEKFSLLMLDDPIIDSHYRVDNQNDETIPSLAEHIEDMILSINETCKNHGIPMIFTPTYLDSRIYRYLRTPVNNREMFTHFALNLYLLVFERTSKINGTSQKLGLLPTEFQRAHQFIQEVDVIRHEYGDAHIVENGIFQSTNESISVGEVLKRYLGSKKAPQPNQFMKLQYGLLNSLRLFLVELDNHLTQI